MDDDRRLLVFNLAVDADDSVLAFTSEWLTAFAARVDHLDVITMRAGRVDVPANVAVHSVGKERGWSEPRRALRFVQLLRGVLRQGTPIGCFAHMNPVFLTLAAPALHRRHIPSTLWWTSDTTPWWLRTATRAADVVVTATDRSFPLALDGVRAIGHGIDADRFPLLPAHGGPATRLVSIGRITPAKRQHVLLEAVATLRAGGTPVTLDLVGAEYAHDDPAYRRRLDERIVALELGDAVTFVGAVPRPRMAEVHGAADVIVNVAATGAYDKSTLEAMCSGRPVVVVDDDADACVVAARIRDVVLADPVVRDAQARAAAERVRREHRLDDVVTEVLRTFAVPA